jgi:hypothetical protein
VERDTTLKCSNCLNPSSFFRGDDGPPPLPHLAHIAHK